MDIDKVIALKAEVYVAGVAEWLRRWAADSLYMGSIPIPSSTT